MFVVVSRQQASAPLQALLPLRSLRALDCRISEYFSTKRRLHPTRRRRL